MTSLRWAATASLAVALIGCGTGDQGSPGGGKPKAALVTVSEVKEGEASDVEDFTGRTEAVETVDVRAQATGYLDKVGFKEDTLVKKGDMLYEIDPRTYAADLKRAEAEVSRNIALLDRLRSDQGRARRSGVGTAVSREEYDKITSNLEETAASLESARAVVLGKKLALEFCKVLSPIEGRVGRTLVTKGNLVRANEMKLTTIVSVAPIYAYFDVDERTVLRIKRLIDQGKVKSARDAKVPIFLGTQLDEGYPIEGHIDFVDNQLDPATGTLRVRGVFANKDLALTPGLFVRLRMPLGEKRKRPRRP